jgi:hypothetical protein
MEPLPQHIVDQMDKLRLKMQKKQERKTDLIEKNKMVVQNPEFRITRHLARDQNIFDAHSKKKQLETENYKYKVMLTLKWALIKEKRKEFLVEAVIRNKKRLFAEWWIRSASNRQVMTQVYSIFSEVRQKD